MFKRQPLAAVASPRPRCPVSARAPGPRFRSELQKRPDTLPTTNPPPERTPTQHNRPATGRSRGQRAAQVSEEVRMLGRGSTAATVPGSSGRYPSARARGADPAAFGGQGRMGANDSVSRGGPTRQGPGRPSRAGQPRQQGRGGRPTPTPRGAAGGGDAEDGATGGDGLGDVSDPMGNSTANELVLLERFDRQDVTAVAFAPEPVTRDEYLRLGQNGATIAGANFGGVVEDRLRQVAEPTQDAFRHPPDMAARLAAGHLVSFDGPAEKSAVLAAVPDAALDFAPVGPAARAALFDRLVRGAYPDPNAAPHRQKLLNDVHRALARNPSYLAKDSAKLLRKIGSLLPSEAAAGRKPAPRAAAAKK